MRYLQIFALVAGLSALPSIALAQAGAPQRPETPSSPLKATPPQRPQPPPASPPQSPVILQQMPNARETQNQLNEIFNQLPPSVHEVLRIDPTLLYREDYIANYPALAAFIQQHPEVAHNPSFFIGERQFRRDENNSPGLEAARALRSMTDFLGVVLIVITITAGVILLVRTAVEHRRWQRALRTQTDLHAKLIDRFSSSEDLLHYLQSPAGKLLTEVPSLPQAAPRAAMAAPLSRIFWALQAGIVIVALGTGLLVVSRNASVPEVAEFLGGIGVVILTIGVGFTISAVVSYFLSHRLGLVQSLSARYSGETPGS
jgi:hypothetical protein